MGGGKGKASNTQRESEVGSNKLWGDDCNKEINEGMFRTLGGNINGFAYTPNQRGIADSAKEDAVKEFMLNNESHACCWNEMNMSWKNVDPVLSLREREVGLRKYRLILPTMKIGLRTARTKQEE